MWIKGNKTNTLGQSGVYLITFPNGKRYLGSSKDLYKRISTHMKNLQQKKQVSWYFTASIENNFPDYIPSGKPIYNKRRKRNKKYVAEYQSQLHKWLMENPKVKPVWKYPDHYEYEIPWKYYTTLVDIKVCICDNYREYESYLLQHIKNKENYYNTNFR